MAVRKPKRTPGQPNCGAKKADGTPCGHKAGWGTNHTGYGQCKLHGGATKYGGIHAATEEAKVISLSQPTSTHPLTAVLDAVSRQATVVNWWAAKAEQTEDPAVIVLYEESLMRLAKNSKIALDAGVREREVRLAEALGSRLVELLDAVLSDEELGIDPAAGRRVAARHLRAIEATVKAS